MFVKQKIEKLKFVNCSSKIERIVELKMANEQSFIACTYLFMDSNKIEHTFNTYD